VAFVGKCVKEFVNLRVSSVAEQKTFWSRPTIWRSFSSWATCNGTPYTSRKSGTNVIKFHLTEAHVLGVHLSQHKNTYIHAGFKQSMALLHGDEKICENKQISECHSYSAHTLNIEFQLKCCKNLQHRKQRNCSLTVLNTLTCYEANAVCTYIRS
jgi:hypothetical protein